MDKPKFADKFRVGQVALLVLNKSTGYERRNGQRVTILRQRVWGEWHCADPLSSRAPETCADWRYRVRVDDDSDMNVTQRMLCQIYDDEKLSTWAKFAKATGLRLDKQLAAIERTPAKRRRRGSEARDAW